ncbi:MAG: hypothetical protein AAGK05_17150, partial [Pseudomonadota bacterium]
TNFFFIFRRQTFFSKWQKIFTFTPLFRSLLYFFCLNFRSFVPRNYKVNLIKALANRAFKICSPECLSSELNTIREALIENDYPPFFIDRYLHHKTKEPPVFGPKKKQIFIRLPFIGDKAASFARRSLYQCLKFFSRC